MPPRKYTDFVESAPRARMAKRGAQDERDVRMYVAITCPHCSEDFVEITVDSLATNKASECKKHLARCRAASRAGVRPEPLKRRRVERGGASVPDTLQAELDAERARSTTLAASETRLTGRNDELTSRVHSLEGQVEQMRADILQLQPLVPLVQRISEELGLSAAVPPAAPIDTYVGRLAGLKKAAAVAELAEPDGTIARLKGRLEEMARLNHQVQAANEALRHSNRKLYREKHRLENEMQSALKDSKKHAEFWGVARALFDNPPDSIGFIKKMLTYAHPDKHAHQQLASTAVTKLLNRLLHDLRQQKQ